MLVGTLPFLIGAVSLLLEAGGGLYWVAAGIVTAIAGGVTNAWSCLFEYCAMDDVVSLRDFEPLARPRSRPRSTLRGGRRLGRAEPRREPGRVAAPDAAAARARRRLRRLGGDDAARRRREHAGRDRADGRARRLCTPTASPRPRAPPRRRGCRSSSRRSPRARSRTVAERGAGRDALVPALRADRRGRTPRPRRARGRGGLRRARAHGRLARPRLPRARAPQRFEPDGSPLGVRRRAGPPRSGPSRRRP